MISACGTVMQVGPYGRAFNLWAPSVGQVTLEDAVPALAKICRFGGHCREFYSVAQHSVLVALLCPGELVLEGLLHDVPEAYLGDIVSPMKAAIDHALRGAVDRPTGRPKGLHAVCSLLAGVEGTVAEAVGSTYPVPEVVKQADLVACAIEREQLMPASTEVRWEGMPPAPAGWTINPLPPHLAVRLWWGVYDQALARQRNGQVPLSVIAGDVDTWTVLEDGEDVLAFRRSTT